jgi:chromosome segregation ATPase
MKTYNNLGNVISQQWMQMYYDSQKELEAYKKVCKNNEVHINKLLHDISLNNEQLSKKNIEIVGLNSHIKELESEIDNLKKQIAFKKYENEPTDEEIFAILGRRGYYGNLVKQTEIQIGSQRHDKEPMVD